MGSSGANLRLASV